MQNYIPEQGDYKKLTPFKLAVLQNFPYIEADFDALTNYGLMCKIVEYLNNVIENENTVENNVSNLYNSFISLHNYVANYFEELDVQEEVNIKLDMMAEDGTITNLLKDYIDPVINQQNARINAIDDLARSSTSGSPAGVYPTLSALELADPDHTKIYIVSSDGNWYYYNSNTSSWISGGLYQASEDSDTVKRLKEIVDEAIHISNNLLNPITSENNKALSSGAGVKSDNDQYWLSNPIHLTETNKTVRLFYQSEGVNGYKCCFYNNQGFVSSDGFAKNTYTAPDNATYLIIQFRKAWIPFEKASEVMVNYGTDALPYEPYGAISYKTELIPDNSIGEEKLKHFAYSYQGEKINLDNKFDSKRAYNWTLNTPEGAPNSAVVYNNLLFHIGSKSGVRVFDISVEPWQNLGDFYLTTDTENAPHCNCAFFGKKYNENDEFPVLYVNAYNNNNLPRATLYGYRIIRGTENSFTAVLVQTITVGFANSTVWTSGNDIRPFGNFVLDEDNNTLYAYTIKDSEKITRFFAFTMPNLSNSNVTLTTSDVTDMFDIPYIAVPQDNMYRNGNIYIASGIANNGYITVINLLSKKIVTKIFLSPSGFTREPEIICYHNGKILQGNGEVYWLTF